MSAQDGGVQGCSAAAVALVRAGAGRRYAGQLAARHRRSSSRALVPAATGSRLRPPAMARLCQGRLAMALAPWPASSQPSGQRATDARLLWCAAGPWGRVLQSNNNAGMTLMLLLHRPGLGRGPAVSRNPRSAAATLNHRRGRGDTRIQTRITAIKQESRRESAPMAVPGGLRDAICCGKLTRAARVGEVQAGLLGGVQNVGVIGALDGLVACGALARGGRAIGEWRNHRGPLNGPTGASVRPCGGANRRMDRSRINDGLQLATEGRKAPLAPRAPPEIDAPHPEPLAAIAPTAGGLQGDLEGHGLHAAGAGRHGGAHTASNRDLASAQHGCWSVWCKGGKEAGWMVGESARVGAVPAA